jgi:hypothetical protein
MSCPKVFDPKEFPKLDPKGEPLEAPPKMEFPEKGSDHWVAIATLARARVKPVFILRILFFIMLISPFYRAI